MRMQERPWKMKAFAILCVAAVVLWSCWHWRGISTGKIVNKRFVPAHTQIHYHHVCVDAKNQHYVNIPYPVLVPDRWYFTIEGKNGSGVVVDSRIEVDSESYHAKQIGSNWP